MRSIHRLLPPLAALVACTQDLPAPTALTTTEPGAILNRGASPWSRALSIEVVSPGAYEGFNSSELEGCPFISRDGRRFFIASTRSGGLGGIDIWMSTRESVDDPWGELVNVGEPINSEANDFCPTLARDGHTFYFVSNRRDGCGGGDIYVARRREDDTFDSLQNLGCAVNSPADEAGPFAIEEPGRGPVLYFSSTRVGGYATDAAGAAAGDSDIYSSEWRGGAYQAATLVPGVNSAAEDGQPNLRRDALELFFYSTRSGGLGAADLYVASRDRATRPWATVANLGPEVNGSGGETRPSLSWDGLTLYFGSVRPDGEGLSDIFVTTRERE